MQVAMIIPGLSAPLASHFGSGAPGWLARDVPENTLVDFVGGVATGPTGKLVRSPGSNRWARAH